MKKKFTAMSLVMAIVMSVSEAFQLWCGRLKQPERQA